MKVLSILLLTLVTCEQIANGYRILGIFPLHGPSHWVMMKPLMIGLAQRGHQVDVVSHFPLKKPIPNYRDLSLAGSIPDVRNNITAANASSFGTFSMKSLTDMAGAQVCELLSHPVLQDLIKNPPQDPPYDLLITEVWLVYFYSRCRVCHETIFVLLRFALLNFSSCPVKSVQILRGNCLRSQVFAQCERIGTVDSASNNFLWTPTLYYIYTISFNMWLI